MSQPPDPLDRVVAAFHALPVPDRPPDAAVLAKLVPTTPRSLWSRTVTRTALFATAASVAAFVGVLLLGGTSPALADVVKAAEKHELVKYKRTQTVTDPHSREPVHQVAVCYDDLRAPRLRAEVHVLTLSELVDSRHVQITDGRKDRTLTVLTETLRQVQQQPDKSQQALFDQLVNKFPRREATLRRAGVTLPGKDKPEPIKPLLAWLRELEANPKSVATRETTTVRYRLEDGPKTTQLWIDPATRLPTRVEHELLLPMQNERFTWAYTDFEWGPKLPAGFDTLDALFSVEPPAGYTLTDETGK